MKSKVICRVVTLMRSRTNALSHVWLASALVPSVGTTLVLISEGISETRIGTAVAGTQSSPHKG
eukprot:5796820-Prymnesium_polylepis.1